MGQEILELINELNIDFSASNISRLLFDIGIISKGVKGKQESLSRLIFLHSDKDEIYSRYELQFIETVGNVYVFPEYLKNISRGNMACRFICVDLADFDNAVYSAVFFMKLIVKALPGFSVFIIKLSDGIHIGIRTFEKKEHLNCTLCEVGQTEEALYSLALQVDDNFLSYYADISDIIRPKATVPSDYDELGIRRRGVLYDYIEGMRQIESLYGISTLKEIIRYEEWYEEKNIITFANEVEDALEDLQYIKSSKVNTLEMLFEADELERLSIETEEKYEATLSTPMQEAQIDEQMMHEYGDNPEEMIKQLKMKHGLM